MLTWRHSCCLLVVSLILITGCSQPEPTIAPTFTPPPPTALPTIKPTATSTLTPTPLPTPTPEPPAIPPLPSANSFASLVPDGAYSVLGVGEITAAAASPDESLTALTTPIGLIMLDTQSFDEVWSVSGDYAIGELYWSPDGTKITTNTYSEVEIRDASTGALLHSWNAQDIYGVYGSWRSVAWSSDSSFIALVGFEIRIWNIDTGVLIHQIEYDYTIYDLVWSPDDTQLTAGARNPDVERAIIWDTGSGEVLYQIEDTPMNWADDLSLLLTRNIDANSWKLWDVTAGEKVLDATGYAKVSPDWSMVAAYQDNRIDVYDIQSRKLLYNFDHPTGSEFYVHWSPDSSKLAAYASDSVYIWEVQSGTLLFSQDNLTIRQADFERGARFIWHPDSQRFFTGVAKDSGYVAWDIESGEKLGVIEGEIGQIGELCKITFLADGEQLLYHSEHGLSLWDMQGLDLRHQLAGMQVVEIIWSDDGAQLATLLDDDFVVIWDVETSTTKRIEPRDLTSEFHFGDGTRLMANEKIFSPDGRFYATSHSIYEETENGFYYNEGIGIRETASSEMVRFLESHYHGEVASVYTRVWSPDGSLLAATVNGNLHIWDVEAEELLDWKTDLSYDALAFSPDGSLLATGADGAIILWEIPGQMDGSP